MKIRTDFVTNSSSSSYMVLYQVDDSPELRQWVKEELGNRGLKTYESSVVSGVSGFLKEIADDYGYELSYPLDDESKEYLEDEGLGDVIDVIEQCPPNQSYIFGSVVYQTSEGAQSDRSIKLAYELPSDKCKQIWMQEAW